MKFNRKIYIINSSNSVENLLIFTTNHFYLMALLNLPLIAFLNVKFAYEFRIV